MSDCIDIAPEQLVEVLADACATYTDDVKKKVHKGIDKIAREAKSEVKAKSQRSKKKYDGNKDNYKGDKRFAEANVKPYNENWTTSTKEENGIYTATVHNKKWQIVHLLEYGHLTRKGTGRTAGKGKEYAKAFPHVNQTLKNAGKKVDELLEDL